MHDVVDAVRLLKPAADVSSSLDDAAAAAAARSESAPEHTLPATEPPSARSSGLAFDLDAPAPVRPAASAPCRLDHGRRLSGGGGGGGLAATVQTHDFECDSCWVGMVRAVDANEQALKRIFEKRCGAIRSLVVREKPDGATADGGLKGNSWALVTFLQTQGKDRAVTAGSSLTGTGGYLIKAEMLCMDDAFNSNGELLSVWNNAKEKAKETTSWDRTHVDAPPKRRHSLPSSALPSDGDGGDAKRQRLHSSGKGDMGTALKHAGDIAEISEVVKEVFLAKGTSGAVFRAQ